jgi:signal transduction histidine kinase/ActR/RegA family two-component response regulator
MKFDSRARREILLSLRYGAVVGILLFAAWFVGLHLLADDIKSGRLQMEGSIMSVINRHVLLAAIVCGLTALVVMAICIHGYTIARLNPTRVELFSKLTENLPGMLYQYRQYPTGRGSVTYSTDAIRSIYEIDPEEARADGTKIMDLLHPDDRSRIWDALLQSHLHLTPWKEEYRVVLPKAGICWRYGHARVERLPDGGTLWHGFVIDITKEKATGLELAVAQKKAEAANLAKSQFLAMMSHDIRTPINGIVGFATLLKDTPLNDSQREHVEAIDQCADSLLCLVNDILDLSKIEAGRMTIEPRPFALLPCLKEVLTVLRPRAQSKGIALTFEMDDHVPPGIETDRTRLVQILTNLLGNAVKFTDEGRVTLHVSCARATDSEFPAQWKFEVSDTGAGISPAQQQRIFEPFHQLEGTHRHEGSGLGLAITRQLCTQLGGDVKLESTPGEGSTFTATILAHVARLAQPEVIVFENTTEHNFPGVRALVVDDHPLNAKLAGLMLRRIGCDTRLVHSAREAIAACAEEVFDIVFMDLQMPHMDGLQATRELRRLEQSRHLASGVPLYIVALTANVMPEDRKLSLDAGMNDYLEKPLREHELVRSLTAMQQPGETAFDCKDRSAA